MTEVTEKTPAPLTSEEERERLRMDFLAALEAAGFPAAIAQNVIGCSRTTLHNWTVGKEISAAYIQPVTEFLEVLNMCLALKALPLESCNRRVVHATFYAAIASLREGLMSQKG